jgi:hypothetical protein
MADQPKRQAGEYAWTEAWNGGHRVAVRGDKEIVTVYYHANRALIDYLADCLEDAYEQGKRHGHRESLFEHD